MKQIIKDGQTLADVAVQEFGSWEAMIAIAHKNGISMTEVPQAATEVGTMTCHRQPPVTKAASV